ncbi:hypothetical protein CAEBREN_28324 [Caenorhabditis brenneri]|uniref:SXP/RAL-2 family protein Ani s 5-like cation-binding domain-containing protein n=1 Tax=Caenorhabditis brenneri TaxID=135651 RepID=G0P5A1_CAEBE|nr:hypothetical protein CAEBREN_28324 [Caenorhabditis brenneri]
MTYSTKVPLLVLLISITVFAGPRGGGGPGRRHGPPMGPPFLQNVTEEGRRAFFDIMRNWNLTLAEMETQTQQWAQTYGVQDAYNQFEANMTAHKEEVKQNVTRVVSQLSQAQSALEQVMDNKNQRLTLSSLSHSPLCLPSGSVNDIAKMFSSLAETILNLQNHNSIVNEKLTSLLDKVAILEEQVKVQSIQPNIDLKLPSTMAKSFAQVVSSSVASTIAAPESQISLMKAASYASTEDARKANVIVKNVDLTEDAIKSELVQTIAKDCGTSTPSVFLLPQTAKGPPIVRLTFKNREEASKVLIKFNSIKASIQGCLNASPRPDLTKPELLKYRQSWKTVIKLNNEAMETLYTVRNLEVTKIVYNANQKPWPWTRKHSIEETI